MKNKIVISLTNEHQRRQHIDTLFEEYELDFGYFDAINKQQAADILAKYNLSVTNAQLSAGEVACYLSHYCLWQQVVEQQLPYLMVFEDDIYFSKSATAVLSNLDWLPSGFDVIKLETMYERVVINKGVRLILGHMLCQMQSRHMGMAGYIISLQGAKKLLAMTNEIGIDRPVDHLIFDRLIGQKNSSVHQVFPALCIQDKIYNKDSVRFASVLEDTRKGSEVVKQKKSGFEKMNKELLRVFEQLSPKNMYYTGWLFMKGYKKRIIDYKE